MKHPSLYQLQQYLDGPGHVGSVTRPSPLVPGARPPRHTDGLSIGERRNIERHVRECAACSHELAQLQQLLDELGSVPDLALPDSFASEVVQAAIRPRPSVIAAGRSVVLLAVVCAALAGLLPPLLGANQPLSSAVGAAVLPMGSPFDTDPAALAVLAGLAIVGSFVIAQLMTAHRRGPSTRSNPRLSRH